MQDRDSLLTQWARAVAAVPAETPLVSRLCTALVNLLGLQGGAVTVALTVPPRSVLCATDGFVERIGELETVLGEGPALDAERLRRPVLATPDELPTRWPVLSRFISEELASSPAYLLAIPMRPEHEVLGVLTLYGRQPLPPDFDLEGTQRLADAIAVAILGDIATTEDPDEPWLARDRLNQATGMVVAQLRIAPDDALAVLRAHAFVCDASMSEIADRVLNGSLDFRSGTGTSSEQGDD